MLNSSGHDEPFPGAVNARFTADARLSADARPSPAERATVDNLLQQCLLETQRQVCRLEEVLHGMQRVVSLNSAASFGAVAAIQESNRRLAREVDAFGLDWHAVMLTMNRQLSAQVLRKFA